MSTFIATVATAIVWFELAVIAYFLVVNMSQAVLMGNAARLLRQNARESWIESRRTLVSSEFAPSVAIIAPAFNEASTIASSVRALLTIDYPALEVVVVNDGSSDATLAVLSEVFSLEPVEVLFEPVLQTQPIRGVYRSRVQPRLLVVDKANGGKADALNVGLQVATTDLVCAIDADTIVEPDALVRIIRPFIGSDEVVAVGGTIRVANDATIRHGRVVARRAPRKLLALLQSVEYLRAFLFGRLGWNGLGDNLIISGAFGLFRREAVMRAGGYAHGTVGEDIELIATMRRQGIEHGTPHRVVFVPDPIAWTEVPESLRVLGRQRDRWHRGLAETLRRNRRVVGNPRYGSLGVVVTPYFVFVELLAPVVELAGVVVLVFGIATGVLDMRFAILFFLVAYGIGMLLSVIAVLLDEAHGRHPVTWSDRVRMLAAALIENLGYRQITVIWRLRGLLSWLRGRSDWGVMERRGFNESS